LRPWLIQSWTWNWSHAAARRFSVVAGWNWSRVSSSRLTTRGLGLATISCSFRTSTRLSGTLRPKRAPALPIVGDERSLNVPSAVRTVRSTGDGDGGGAGLLGSLLVS
jgi:hypothetical protein